MSDHIDPAVGFAPDEIDTSVPTRAARLKWVVVVDEALPPGRAVNAAICVSAATAAGVTGLLGPSTHDATGSAHPGLPWAGCTVLAADAATLRVIRAKAEAHEGTFVADMPAAAQATRVYDDYAASVASAGELDYLAVSLVGPKNRIDKIGGRLPLLP
ncbi:MULTISPECIES: DUF2000 domain-containing protein [unclassified Rathayibacter]|uniref:DUF2000 domain-containing protein n=1 Tax=unclassified Rathayibacter TaxID=2609250 RepID=UPI0006FF922A|nr:MULTISPECIES: DUF2000 domain-containing protein [unclassified Rathayibacter]KQQ03352.1 hypothetical protein ASF42_07410 [Rathayibacter sp. Leaf294]KQS11807.1 hypothetical protein ASG06_07410 [Rathayibacter sp. Leaf185]